MKPQKQWLKRFPETMSKTRCPKVMSVRVLLLKVRTEQIDVWFKLYYSEILLGTEADSDAESIYESRKLLIRQIQGQIAKQVHEERDSVSEYDSWSDLEDNFALAYEPIPLNIKLDTWRKMSKKEILRKVNSKKVRKDFEYLTHGEILDHIEKMQLNARYLSSKFGINHLMTHLDHGDQFQVHFRLNHKCFMQLV